MAFLAAWFLSGLVFFLMAGPLSARDKEKFNKEHSNEEYTPDQSLMFVIIMVWGFIGALFIRTYSVAFFYMASIFVLAGLLPLFKNYSEDKAVYDFTPFGIWVIIGLLIPLFAP